MLKENIDFDELEDDVFLVFFVKLCFNLIVMITLFSSQLRRVKFTKLQKLRR